MDDQCYHQACDTIATVGRGFLDHMTRAIAGTIGQFATTPDRAAMPPR